MSQPITHPADNPAPKDDPTSPEFAGPCPRCQGPIPNAEHPGEYPGALSRQDNRTYICSSCGTAEAMWNFTRRGEPFPVGRIIY